MNPVTDFLKYAEASQVKAHIRRQGSKSTLVDAHARKKDDAPKKKYVPLEGAELRSRQAKELALWQTWKDGGQNPRDLRPLLKSFAPLIKMKTNVYKGKVKLIPDSAIEAEFQLRFVDALRSYDPSKGSLGTYVYRYLDKAKRFIVENQNIGRIPENRVYKIKKYTTARDELAEDMGTEPTVAQVAKKLKWSNAEAERMDSELRGDLVSQGFEEDPYSITPSKSEEVLRLFKYELEGDDKAVYEYLTGYGKPHITSTGEIAKRLKLEDYQVSRIKQGLQKRLKRYLTD